MNFKKFFIPAMLLLAQNAMAVNKIFLKPDGQNSSPCIVWGSPNNGMACGKASAPAEVLDVQGNIKASGSFLGDGSQLTGLPAGETNTFTSSKTFTNDVLIGGNLSVSSINGSAPGETNTFTSSKTFTNDVLIGGILIPSGGIRDNSNTPSMDANTRILADPTGADALRWGIRELVDSAGGQISVDWQGRNLSDTSGNLSVAYGARADYDASGQVAHDWGSRNLADASGLLSIAYGARQASDASGAVALDWTTARALVNTDTTPALTWATAGVLSVPEKLSVTGAFSPAQHTIAEIEALTPAIGDVYSCSDCTLTYDLVIATGTNPGDFREVGTSNGPQ